MDRRRRIKELFAQALECDDRESVLATAGAEGLREAVEDLLAALEEAGPFLDKPLTDRSGQRIAGRYELLEEIGEGGFGTVYLAEQSEPIRRRVAVKLIKLGMDTGQVVERFQRERQALAVMDHPSVAKILDGGTTATGRPFFVMELIDGAPITEFCDRSRLDLHARLELFEQVCLAVEHAHQKGLLHRDIKPSNVLVTTVDERAVPKIIDFGIAKALEDRDGVTEGEQRLGTPEYMSPEQTAGSADEVDTRTDVYALGVLLYELTTGFLPFSGEHSERLRAHIRETPPERPSARLRTGDAATVDLAARRRASPRQLAGRLAGEIDWIALRALEKQPDRRYPSALELARDVRNFLDGVPVNARPPTRVYLLRKFARRHRVTMGAVSLALIALVAGIAVALHSLSEARADEHSARLDRDAAIEAREQADADRDRAVEGEARAQREAERANTALGLIQRVLEAGDPWANTGPDYTVGALLDELAEGLGPMAAEQPEAAARLSHTIGVAWLASERADKAAPFLASAVRLQGELGHASAGDADVRARHARTLADYASALIPGEPAAAEPLLDRAFELVAGSRPQDHWLVLDVMSVRGAARFAAHSADPNAVARAEAELRTAYERMPAGLAERRRLACRRYARLLEATGRVDEARALGCDR